MAFDLSKLAAFNPAMQGQQGLRPIQQPAKRPVDAIGATSTSSAGLVEQFNKMDKKSENKLGVSNQFAGMHKGKDNYTANKLDLLA